ncbi:MAG: hypothetical protein IKD11_01725 [Oscillospiraceae bacterium]|nr:hypothetical protein [Oscillospiraceae bacterium]
MSEFENKLNTLLADPNAMAQVMQLAESLQGQLGSSGESAPPPPKENANDLLSQLTGGLDPALLTRLLPVVQQLNRPESSETSQLLYALRPFLRPERRDKVERAAQLARLFHLARVFFTKEGKDV